MNSDNETNEHLNRKHGKSGVFPRRYYPKITNFWRDFSDLMSHRDQIREAMRSEDLPPDFRERLMLAVTEVNQCRYCRTFHVQQAGLAGLTDAEIRGYLEEAVPPEVPENQKLGVSYARSWAESNQEPPAAFRDQLLQEYGEKTAQAIEIALRMIWMGNLLGNTLDYFFYRISFGRWGGVGRSRENI